MGNDSCLACLSDKPRMLYDYFKQLFAQVTNPAIDSIREEVIMSLECYIGPEQNLVETTEQHAHRLRVPHPILSNEQLAAIQHMEDDPSVSRGWKTRTIDITWSRSAGKVWHGSGARPNLRRGRDGDRRWLHAIVVLSDRATNADRVPLSSLLADRAPCTII